MCVTLCGSPATPAPLPYCPAHGPNGSSSARHGGRPSTLDPFVDLLTAAIGVMQQSARPNRALKDVVVLQTGDRVRTHTGGGYGDPRLPDTTLSPFRKLAGPF